MTLPHKINYDILAGITPKLRYGGNDFNAWQKTAREKLAELLGLDKFEKCDFNLIIESDKQTDEFRQIRFLFESEKGYTVPCYLLVPNGKSGKIPVFICLQGHSTGMHNSLGIKLHENDNPQASDGDFALRIVKEGYCALAIEQRNFGERGWQPKKPGRYTSEDCFLPSMTALLIGRTTIGARVWDISRAIDVITESFDFIDKDRIGCMGNSGGGTATFYAACMDERIRYAMPSCSVCTFKDSIAAFKHCTCNYIPNIANYFDMGDLSGLIAPRPLVIVAGKEDNIFLINGVRETFEITKKMYAAADANDNCRLVEGEGGHRFFADLAWSEMNKIISEK